MLSNSVIVAFVSVIVVMEMNRSNEHTNEERNQVAFFGLQQT